MFIALSLMLVTTSITHITYAMETPDMYIHTSSHSIENSQLIPLTVPKVKERKSKCALIKATQKNDLITLQKILEAPLCNPNERDAWDSTALHHAALRTRVEVINTLLRDPRVDASIKDSDDKCAHKLIDAFNFETIELRKKLSARAKLDLIINQERCEMLMDLPITDEKINNAVNIIKDKSALILIDTNDEFIKQMIVSRITQ